MKFKKLKSLLAAGLITLIAQGTASAYDMMWFDRSANIDRFDRIVVFPMADGTRDNFYPSNSDKYKDYNYELHKRLTRHAKGIYYYELFDAIEEKMKMAEAAKIDIRNKLLVPFPNEAARAAAINEYYMPNGYIIPFFRFRDVVVDYSPAAYVDVTVRAYTHVDNAPNAQRTGGEDYDIDESSWVETVYVPEAYLNRNVTALEFTMYNDEGKKIFTCLNRRHSYSESWDDQYKDMKDDFADDLKDIKKNKDVLKHNEKNKSTLKIRMGNLTLPDNVSNDEYKLKSCWYLFKTHAFKMKNMKVLEGNEASEAQYYVDGNISRYDFTPRWIPAYATSGTKIAWTRSEKWWDILKHEHTMTVTRYEPTVTPHHGYYDFSSASTVVAHLALYDAKTGKQVLAESYREVDDKEVDCLTHIMKNFFKKVDKYAEEQLKN